MQACEEELGGAWYIVPWKRLTGNSYNGVSIQRTDYNEWRWGGVQVNQYLNFWWDMLSFGKYVSGVCRLS